MNPRDIQDPTAYFLATELLNNFPLQYPRLETVTNENVILFPSANPNHSQSLIVSLKHPFTITWIDRIIYTSSSPDPTDEFVALLQNLFQQKIALIFQNPPDWILAPTPPKPKTAAISWIGTYDQPLTPHPQNPE